MKFLFGDKITFTSVEGSAGNWWIKQEQKIFTGDMLYLGYVDIKKSESVKLLQDIAALPPSSTSLDAMNAVVEFFLSSSRWNFQRDRTNCNLWKELVKAKRNPSAYEGVWKVDKLLEESTSGDPVTPHSLEAAPMERIQNPTLEGKQRDHQSPATAPMGHPANPTFDELFDDLRHSGTYKNHDNGQDEMIKRAHEESVDDFFLIVPYYLNKVVRTKLGGTVSKPRPAEVSEVRYVFAPKYANSEKDSHVEAKNRSKFAKKSSKNRRQHFRCEFQRKK
ncbi:hypothetical protein EV360DRAFT_72166 [Lentinula raphanica]|nr:hypothetical protein EV360DRAFT_72166 [Lentinula raphanica]